MFYPTGDHFAMEKDGLYISSPMPLIEYPEILVYGRSSDFLLIRFSYPGVTPRLPSTLSADAFTVARIKAYTRGTQIRWTFRELLGLADLIFPPVSDYWSNVLLTSLSIKEPALFEVEHFLNLETRVLCHNAMNNMVAWRKYFNSHPYFKFVTHSNPHNDPRMILNNN
jgi:hypothetical protein